MYYNFDDTDAYMFIAFGIGVGGFILLIIIFAIIASFANKVFRKRNSSKRQVSETLISIFLFVLLILWFCITIVLTSKVGFIFYGGKEEQSLKKKYEVLIKETTEKLDNNYDEVKSQPISNRRKNSGIIVLSKDEQGVFLESYLMVNLPNTLKPKSDDDPQLIMLISAKSEPVAERYGYDAGTIYSSSYIFKMLDFKSGQLIKTIQSPSIEDKNKVSKFPIDFYEEVLLEVQNIMTQYENVK